MANLPPEVAAYIGSLEQKNEKLEKKTEKLERENKKLQGLTEQLVKMRSGCSGSPVSRHSMSMESS